MANYTLNVLRNHTVYPSKEAAIEVLNLFEHHSYGQPLTLLYTDEYGSHRVLFVVGVKNADEETEVKCGPDFYEIINDLSSVKGEVDWKTYLEGDIIDTDEPLNIVSLSASDFSTMLAHWDERYSAFDDYLFFVADRDNGMIYKGKVPYSGSGGGSYILPIASDEVLGGIKVGENLSIDENGVLSAEDSYELPIASSDTLGGIKVGSHLSIDSNGVLSAEEGSQGHRYNSSKDSLAEGTNSSKGTLPIASENRSHAEGDGTIASGEASHAEGMSSYASGDGSHAEGHDVVASGMSSHAEGCGAEASGNYSHAEGDGTISIGYDSHAEGCGWQYTSRFTFSGSANALQYTTNMVHGLSEGDVVKYKDNSAKILSVPSNTSFTTDHTLSPSGVYGEYLVIVESGVAYGDYSHSEGRGTSAIGTASHAEGQSTTASGEASHAEGNHTKASGMYSHAEGCFTEASGDASEESTAHAEGAHTKALGRNSHAEGKSTIASGKKSHAEGQHTIASGYASHAEGKDTQATHKGAHAEGYGSLAKASKAHAEGDETEASAWYAHAEGWFTLASGIASHAEGRETRALQGGAHAEGKGTIADGYNAHSEGLYTIARGGTSHAEGLYTESSGMYSHAEGCKSESSGKYSHAEGYNTESSGMYSHAEGQGRREINCTFRWTQGDNFAYLNSTTKDDDMPEPNLYAGMKVITPNNQVLRVINIIDESDISDDPKIYFDGNFNYTTSNGTLKHFVGAIGMASHAEGWRTEASGNYSHAEGWRTEASGNYSHAEGSSTKAFGDYSHTEGCSTEVSGDYSHAEGWRTEASGNYSHAEGLGRRIINGTFRWNQGSNIAYLNGENGDYPDTDMYVGMKVCTPAGQILKVTDIKGNSDLDGDPRIYFDGNFIDTASSNTLVHYAGALDHGAHSEGCSTEASGMYSHAEGWRTESSAWYSHAEGVCTVASANGSHAEGAHTETSGEYSHVEGFKTYAGNEYSHAENYETIALGGGSHAEGSDVMSLGWYSHAEGEGSLTAIPGTFTWGELPDAIEASTSNHKLKVCDVIGYDIYDPYAWAKVTYIDGTDVHIDRIDAAHGWDEQDVGVTLYKKYGVAYGWGSHSEGNRCNALGGHSHVSGYYNISDSDNQFVIGECNSIEDSNQYAFILGNGTNTSNRSNALAIKHDGTIVMWNNGTKLELTPAKLAALLALV